MSQQFELLALNRGTVSRLALARKDIKRVGMSAEEQSNIIPRAMGSAMLRPGLGMLDDEPGITKLLEFIFAADDSALVELHNLTASFVKDDLRIIRPAVPTTITNGNFNTNLAGWTIVDAGTVNAWQVGGYAGLAGNGVAPATLRQQVPLNIDVTEHGLRVVVARGSVVVRVGSSATTSEYVNDVTLGVGTHSLAFVPLMTSPFFGEFYVTLYNLSRSLALVDSVTIDASGDLTLPTPWEEADLTMVRDFQSGDVIFVACKGRQQRRIVRRDNRSWSVETYAPDDGPFLTENVSGTTLSASAITGNGITVTSSGTASIGVFKPGHVGALFRLSSVGQAVTSNFTAANQFSNSIRVTGVGAARAFSIVITGTFTATVTLQYSTDNAGWTDRATYTAPTSTSLTDGLDNQIIYYRLGVKTGDYTSGTAVGNLSFAAGSITGVVRVTQYTSPTSVLADVLTDLGGTAPTNIWAEGAWSDVRGFPTAVTILDGRLWWAGKDRFWGSIVDAYNSFNPDFEGDAGPVSRSIGFGPVDVINWLLPMDRLMAGTAGSELTCQSSAFDEPLTATNFTPKESSTQGSAKVQALKIDDKVIMVQRCRTRIYEMEASSSSGKFTPEDLTGLNPDACAPGVVYMTVQRQPDTRVHFVLSDGTVAMLVFDKAENLICWLKVETDGFIEDAAVLPGTVEDSVYYVVRRNIGGIDRRFLEKWALESEAQGATVNKQADCFVTYSGAATNTITGLGHLEGEQVIAWAGGVDKSPGVGAEQTKYTVAGGQITIPGDTFTSAVAGLPYEGRFKSSKLVYLVPPGKSGLGAKKKVGYVGLVLADAHAKGLEFGPSYEVMDPLPDYEGYEYVDQDLVREAYEEQLIEFPGEWTIDARLCLRMTAPRPCTILGAVIDMDTRPK
jgi:hypothetical protein